MSHPVLEVKPNENHVRARIRNSRTHRLHSWTSSHIAQNNSENRTLLHQDVQDILLGPCFVAEGPVERDSFG
jgi:hypothetical protein